MAKHTPGPWIVDYPTCPKCGKLIPDGGICWGCGFVFPPIRSWVSDRTEEPCPHCGKTRDEGRRE